MGFLNLGHCGRCVQRFVSNFAAASKGAAASVPVIASTCLILLMNPITSQFCSSMGKLKHSHSQAVTN